MKLGIVIREAGFISSRIFINVYKTQCFQMLCGILGFIKVHADFYISMLNWCGNGAILFERDPTRGKVND